MRVTAEELAQATHALLIGVGRYERPGLEELSAAKDVERLERALTDPAFCGIPPRQVTRLVDEEATRPRIESELSRLAATVDERSSLFIYFSGHGHRLDENFVFHLYDTDPEDVGESGLTATAMTAFLADSPARGVLVAIDCCVGAGFAETAPEFFFDLGKREYRIALSASRADEPSWEIPGDGGSLFTKHLARLLEGKVATGQRPGEVTYRGLVDGLTFAINEDLESWRPTLPHQQLVANGSTVSDPLLFVSARAAMKGVTVNTQRISREYLRHVLVKSAIGSIVALFLAVGLFAAWMSAHEYASAATEGTSIYRGYPGLTGLGYPVPLYRLSYGPADYRTGSPLYRNEPLTLMGSGRILDAVSGELNPVLRAAFLAERGERESARRLLHQAPGLPPLEISPSYRIQASAIRTRLSTPEQIARVRRNLNNEAAEMRHSAVLALLELDRDGALEFFQADIESPSPRHEHPEVLLQLTSPCTESALDYLQALAHSNRLINFRVHLLLAWRKLGCSLSESELRALVSGYDFDLVEQLGPWAKHLGFETPEAILNDADLDFSRRVSFAVGWRELKCQRQWLEAPAPEHELSRVQLLRHAVDACEGAGVLVEASRERLRLTLLRDGKKIGDHQIELIAPLADVNRQALAFRPALELLVRLGRREAEPFLIRQVLEGEKTVIAQPALRAARVLDIEWQPGQGFFRGGNDQYFSLEYFLWYHSADPESVERTALERLADGRSSYFERLLARVGISAEALLKLQRELDESRNERTEPAARIIAMYGDLQALEALASHSEPGVRRALITHGPFNEALSEWFRKRPRDSAIPLLDDAAVARNLEHLRSLRQELDLLNLEERCWLLDLELDKNDMPGFLGHRKLLAPGIRYWLEREREACGFYLASLS